MKPVGPDVAAETGKWGESHWNSLQASARRKALARPKRAYALINALAKRIMRKYTTSFFIVSRFLPRDKRIAVEIIYAAVRYPDEIVDTFPLNAAEKHSRLDKHAEDFERGLQSSFTDNIAAGISVFIAAFIEVLRRHDIPPAYYRSFLDAMRRDIEPKPFATLENLIDDYIYGSAVVVGYFLTHVYGASDPALFATAKDSARELGIGLQLTNFLRDVREDYRRGRIYLPSDILEEAGLEADADPTDPSLRKQFLQTIRQLAEIADGCYNKASGNITAFAADSRLAIQACIDVYRALNDRIRHGTSCLEKRESVPFKDKWAVLPPSKYWRIPAAYFPG